MPQCSPERRPRSARYQREGGYLLLSILLMMAFMVVTLTYVVAPNMVQQIKRDREEEMIHRGTEYARAIKKFYKKNGRYPASLDDLDKGQIRYLRQRYKDPLTKDGKWKLLNYGDIQTLLNAAAPGTPAAALGQQAAPFTPGGGVLVQPTGSGFGGSTFGSQSFGSQTPQSVQQQQQFGGQQNPGTVIGLTGSSDQGSNSGSSSAFGSSNQSGGSNQQGGSPSDQQGNTGNQSVNFSGTGISSIGQSSGGNTTFGGGAIVGVASLSKDPTIRIYNKKKKYDEWQFIYNPAMDQQNVLLRGPYQPTTIGNTNIGTPASQLNGQPQQNGPGQQNSPFGQQNSGYGQSGGFGQQQPGSNPSPNQSQQ